MTFSGTGYIGSFTSLALLENGYEVVVVDNLYNSSEVALDRIELICGKRPKFYKADITDKEALDKIFQENPAIDSVIHFAALKASWKFGAQARTPIPASNGIIGEVTRLIY